jgi:hypothetical protein
MATVLGVPGRFGEVAITRSDVKAIKEAGCRCTTTALDRVWDRVKDWFCNTKLVEAKLHLQVLYDPDASVIQKTESYFALKSMVGPAYVSRFAEENEDFGFSLNIDFGSDLEPYSSSVVLCNQSYLTEQLNADVDKAAADPELALRFERELAMDLARCRFTIAGEVVGDLQPEVDGQPGNIENFRAALLGKFDLTPQQLHVLELCSYQKTFGIVMESGFQENGGAIIREDLIHVRGDGDFFIDFNSRGDDVEIHLAYVSTWLVGLDTEPSILMQDPVHETRLLVSPEGKITALSAVLGRQHSPHLEHQFADTNA